MPQHLPLILEPLFKAGGGRGSVRNRLNQGLDILGMAAMLSFHPLTVNQKGRCPSIHYNSPLFNDTASERGNEKKILFMGCSPTNDTFIPATDLSC